MMPHDQTVDLEEFLRGRPIKFDYDLLERGMRRVMCIGPCLGHNVIGGYSLRASPWPSGKPYQDMLYDPEIVAVLTASYEMDRLGTSPG